MWIRIQIRIRNTASNITILTFAEISERDKKMMQNDSML
jgi:hypothetical protein